MTRYIIRRLLIAVPVLWGIITITFIISEIMPGDYVDALVPPGLRLELGVDEAQLQRLRESYGLDKPVVVRYAIWLRELLLHGNLGYSFVTGQPALQEMAQVLPATLQLSIVTILFSLVVGTSLGIISAIKQYSVLDHLLTLQAFVWISTPGFVFAIIALYLFSLKLPLFPTGGRAPLDGPDNLLVRLHYLALPALVLGFEGLAGHMRYARASLLEALGADYVRTARAKGLPERSVYLGHAFRNSLLPVITIVGLSLPGIIGGSFIIETIFVWPGMGKLGMESVFMRNQPMIMAMNLIGSSMVLFANLLADITYAWADPRIRYE